MSQAPVRRKSRKAVAAAIEKNAAAARKKPAPAPHLVVLRVKRKRGDAAVESLLVATTDEGERGEEQEVMPNRKRRAAGTTSIAETMAVLSLDKTAESQRQQQQHPPLQQQQPAVRIQPPRRLVYKRVRTTEPDGSRDRGEEGRSPVAGAPPARQKLALDGGEGGGRLAALLRSKGLDSNPASCPPPPSTAAVLDYLEVRRVKARAVGIVPKNIPASAGSLVRGGHEQHPSPQSSGLASDGAAAAAPAAPANLHVIDLHAVGQADATSTTVMDTSVMDDAGAAGDTHVATAKRAAAPILTPVERQMDEAIFMAFQTGVMSSLRDILTTSSFPSPAGVNYRRRLGDASTALMAAAFHGDLDTVRHLLSIGAKATLVDAHGRSAALFAGMRGHRKCFAELQRVADQEEEEARVRSSKRRSSGGEGGGGGGGGGDFVYDLYYYEPPTPAPTVGPSAVGASAPGAGTGAPSAVPTSCGKLSEKRTSIGAADDGAPPVVRLSGIGPVDENAVGTMAAGVELEFEHDSDWSGLGEEGDDGEDPDSNSEGYYGNDYPEDEGDDDGAGISPYVYAGGSGSSCASDSGSSSSDGNAGFDSDSDNEPYYRRVVDVHEEFSRNFGSGGGGGGGGSGGLADVEDSDDFDGVSGVSADGSGSGVGVDGLVKRMPPTSGRGDGRDGATGTAPMDGVSTMIHSFAAKREKKCSTGMTSKRRLLSRK